MANRPAPALGLRAGDRERLARLTRSSTVEAGLVLRAGIVLAAADGEANERIAERVGASKVTVLKWRSRYAAQGIAGLADRARSGRPRVLDHREIVAETLKAPPRKYGVTHWSSRLSGRHVKVGNGTVAKAWREYGVAPWRVETFTFSTDPEPVAKVTDVVGLYLAPPENAIVLCVDEKSQIQALDRTAPMLAMQPGLAERRTHDYKRHGTTTLFAALEVATGKVTGAVKARHRHQEFLAFGKQVARAYPDTGDGVELHLVMDDYAAHKKVEVRDWLAANPRIHVHFTPTSGSWPDLVEVWFGIIEHQTIHRGTFTSVRDLNAKIRAFVDGWNDRAHPFVWTGLVGDMVGQIPKIGHESAPGGELMAVALSLGLADQGRHQVSVRVEHPRHRRGRHQHRDAWISWGDGQVGDGASAQQSSAGGEFSHGRFLLGTPRQASGERGRRRWCGVRRRTAFSSSGRGASSAAGLDRAGGVKACGDRDDQAGRDARQGQADRGTATGRWGGCRAYRGSTLTVTVRTQGTATGRSSGTRAAWGATLTITPWGHRLLVG